MKARMPHPVAIVPSALKAIRALGESARETGIPESTIGLVELRASQINGCGVCVDMHSKLMKAAGDTDERLCAVASWRDAPYFTDAERAALALTEAVTRLSDRPEPVPDELWQEAERNFDQKQLAGLLLAISTINVWNRLNSATRQVAGEWRKAGNADERAQRHPAQV
jgi:AhpD family alkylhydroperoxidase